MRRGRAVLRDLTVLLCGLCVLSSGLVVGMSAASAAVSVKVYVEPGLNKHGQYGITAGPDGFWFTNGDGIGRITTSGQVTAFSGRGIFYPCCVAAGPDGGVWFTNSESGPGPSGYGTIGRIASTGAVTDYANPGIDPTHIVAGPDGAMWFTNSPAVVASIGRITTRGAITTYPIGTVTAPQDIVAGPDGALWFRGQFGIGRITTSGLVTIFADGRIADFVGDIAAGPDGALWFANNHTIGRITTTGAISLYPVPGRDDVGAIVAGPDDAMWFTDGGSLERITMQGVVTTYAQFR
ncbi:MAG: Virginiamycin B lyase [Acidimicrobiia bacterium]